MAALALITAACSNDDTDFTQQPQQAKGITITAQLAPKTNGASTRAVEDKATYIETKWAVDEHIAILYNKDGYQMADARISAVDETTGVATITFTVVEGTSDGTSCTLVYPLSAAKGDKSGVKDAATLLAAQDGTLNTNLDVRVGAGTIQTATPGLTVTTQPTAQFAIFKFTVMNADASATISVRPLTISTGGQDYVITPTEATSTLYAALPAISEQSVTFTATSSDSKNYLASKASVSFAVGKFYQSTLKMAQLHPFTVSSGKKVLFAPSNLQATTTNLGTNWTWHFAANQWDYIGGDESGSNPQTGNNFINSDGTMSANGTVDLFGWSTSATTFGINSSNPGDYSGDFVDWGENIGTGWRTLSQDEWTYLFDTRTVNGGKGNGKSYTLGQSVNGKLGIVIYPDNYTGDTYAGENWSTFESAGCVFLPAAGSRAGVYAASIATEGRYWSSSYPSADAAYYMNFTSGSLKPSSSEESLNYFSRSNGCSVRLVRDL